MIIDAHATDTVPSHEVRQRANEALTNAGEPMSEVTYDALRKRIAELEAALATARRDGMEAAAKWHDEQAAKAQKLSDMKVSAEDEKAWGDYAENHREYAAEIRAAALAGGKDD